ncbi:MAG: phosphoribosylformylglycinamidine synthase subunit PurL [Actinobacteria bacterium]|nr:phosphoribosylformylglycinamidine synthase subunit PurL [Actinomycetota bacterium]
MIRDVKFTVGPATVYAAGSPVVNTAADFGIDVSEIAELRVVHVRGDLNEVEWKQLADALLGEGDSGASLAQWWQPAGLAIDRTSGGTEPNASAAPGDRVVVVETGLRPGVTDREGAEFVRSARQLRYAVEAAAIGRRFLVSAADLDDVGLATLAARVLHNEVIERWSVGELAAAFIDDADTAPEVALVALRGLDEVGLAAVNRGRRLGLDPQEMIVIRDHFDSIDRDPTDAELETIAQTWSEHCAHKTFRASISVVDQNGDEVESVDGLLSSYLRAATDELDAPWVRSAFVDNAGIVAFDDDFDIALKAETHNHPSALEPFGGANTGVGGVVRDILGVSAKPIALSDILCFGPTDLDTASLPDGVLHPRRVRNGVIAGVGDYGNKIGVPNIAGAIVHDPAYTTTPLVFAGCIGLLPHGSNPTNAQPGDHIVVLGGAVGRDGVGGATFSSQTMQAATADAAGSSVQIGDPIVEKGLIDVVLAARDAKLYTAITDCGAGGLSSAVGEMAEVLGAEIDLALVPRKYVGLAPWEVWLSEAQERMVIAVPDAEPVLALAKRWSVGAAVIGRFTGDHKIVVTDGSASVIDITCDFLHGGRPRRHMTATVPDVSRPSRTSVDVDVAEMTLALLSHPSIRSNEAVLRTYDHEIQGGTVVRPFGGVAGDGPADGTTTIPQGTSGKTALVVGIGVNAVLGRIDPEAMAWHVVDEAVRNAVIGGADPHQLSLLDNFAWGNPTDPHTLGGLVAAVRGCRDASLAFKAPFVSGKDSLYNVFVDAAGQPDPVAPTLVLTAVGLCHNPAAVPLTGLVSGGNEIWFVGPLRGALGGSHLDQVLGIDNGGAVPPADPSAVGRHHQMAAAIAAGLVHSAHDPSEGGLAVAVAEWALGGRLGVDLDLVDDLEVLFGEGSGRYLVEVAPEDSSAFEAMVPTSARIGAVIAKPEVRLGSTVIDLDQIVDAYTNGVLP